MRYVFLILMVFAALMLAAGCVETTRISSDTSKKVELLNWTATAEGGFYGPPIIHVTGELRNIAGKRLSLVSISAKFYDESGAVVGNGVDLVSDLDAGETWKFDIMYMGYADQIRLDEIIAY